jgi:hypothetical protein
LLKISGGEITIFVSNSDPYRFPVQSHNIEIFAEVVGYLLFLCFSWIFLLDADEYNLERIWISIIDILIFIFTISIIADRLLGKSNSIYTIIKGNYDSLIPILRVTEFINKSDTKRIKISKKIRNENPLLNLLMANESQTLEFKSSLWTQYNEATGKIVKQQNKKMLELEDEVVKTVAAFLNTDGGTLLIGVKDKPRSSGNTVAEIRGIEADFKWLRKKDIEGYTHALIQIFSNAYSNSLSYHNTTISFPEFEGKIVCRIDVEALPRKIGQQCYTKTKIETEFGKSDLFFTRTSDTTKNESPRSQYGYIRHHFEGYSLETYE